MAGSAGTEDYNAAGNSDFSRKAMALADEMLSNWPGPRAEDSESAGKRLGRDVSDTLTAAARDWSMWPGPDAGVFGDGHDLTIFDARRAAVKAKGINGNGMGEPLAVAAARQAQWMGPNVPNGGRTANHADQMGATLYHEGKKVQLGLEHQAKAWAGPAARDYRSDYSQLSAEELYGSKGQPLSRQATHDFHPPSSPAPPIAGGSTSSTDGPNTNQPSARRKLNPIFVEALMRWPTGLSGFERPETAWTRWWLLMPSYVLALCSQKPAAQGNLF
jgi:hypothetical protein